MHIGHRRTLAVYPLYSSLRPVRVQAVRATTVRLQLVDLLVQLSRTGCHGVATDGQAEQTVAEGRVCHDRQEHLRDCRALS